MRRKILSLRVLFRKNMSDNEIEDIQFLPGPSTGKRSVYEPKGLQKCKQLICSPTQAVLIIAISLAVIFMVALIASLARPPSQCQTAKSSVVTNSNTTPLAQMDGKSFPWDSIRLPTDVIPLAYDLFLHPNLTSFMFTGSVTMTLLIQKNTNSILFNAKNLTFTSHELYQWDPVTETRVNKMAISKLLESKKHEQVFLETWEDLTAGQQYILMLEYSGYCGDGLAGFYRSAYETPSKEKRWILTTHFESSEARSAFPCFDEPEFKATFTLSMVRDLHHISLFNTEKIGEDAFDEDPRLRIDRFAESVKMSTYLVAFVVCDYKAVTAITEDGKNVSVYAPADLIDEAALAIDVAPKILSFYEDFYRIAYPLTKSDHIAVPDFAAGAMENWGLITYRMRALLVNEQTASPFDEQWVVIVIAHELAHQWFGNLVTMTWWNDLWLNEGFASFMEYKGADFVRPEWKMWDQFLVGAIWLAFSHDGLRSSHPISVNVTDPKEIEEIFDAITYNKGASIIRMCVFFLGEQRFREGLELYLDKYQFSNANTQDLWMSLSEESTDIDINVEKVMDTWTCQMGYPVVTVQRHGNIISATQQRFLYNPRGKAMESYSTPYDYSWYVPLSYITSDTGYSRYEMVWMNKGPARITLNGSPSWVKVNVNVTGFYRVHYKGSMWDDLLQQLQTDHTVFSAADRASLIEDAFALARSGHLPVSKALDLTTYLTKETEYVVWSTACTVFNYIRQLMEDKGDYSYLQNYLLSLIQPLLDSDMWQPVDDHIQKFLQSLILAEAFHLQDQDLITRALQMFRDWMNNGVLPPPALKSLVYAVGAKYGSNEMWEYLWNKYENPDNPLEKKIYLRAMTATTDSVRIMRILDWSLDLEKVRSADTVTFLQYLASNRGAQLLTWNFVKQNWNTLFNRYKDLAFQMKNLIDVSKHFTSEYFYNEVKLFFDEHLKGQDSRSVSQALESIEMNIDWLKNNQKDLVDWLKKHHSN